MAKIDNSIKYRLYYMAKTCNSIKKCFYYMDETCNSIKKCFYYMAKTYHTIKTHNPHHLECNERSRTNQAQAEQRPEPFAPKCLILSGMTGIMKGHIITSIPPKKQLPRFFWLARDYSWYKNAEPEHRFSLILCID